MAVVMERQYGNIRVRVHDDDYINCTPEEMAQRRRELDAVVRRILSTPEARERLRQINKERYGIE